MYVAMYVYAISYCIIIYVGAALLRKYYNDLWMSLPEDYMNTLHTFNTNKPGDIAGGGSIVGIANLVSSCQNPNKIMLDLLISTVNNDTQLLGFSYMLEKLVKLEGSKLAVIKSFRKGCLNYHYKIDAYRTLVFNMIIMVFSYSYQLASTCVLYIQCHMVKEQII